MNRSNSRVSRLGVAAIAALAIAMPVGIASAGPPIQAEQRVETEVDVISLTAEHATNPLGLPVEAPRLGWQLQSGQRGVVQSAYQVQVASSAQALADGAADVWDSGRVESADSTLVQYDGPALEPATRYHWRVRIWDGDGVASDWSEPAWWETALADGSDLGAQWIGRETKELLPRSNTEQNTPAELEPDTTLGQTFTTDRAFDLVAAKAPTWSTTDSAVTLTLYREGPGGEQIASQQISDVADNSWIELGLDEAAEPGTYYLEMADVVGTIGWWSHTDDVYAHGAAFADGEQVDGDRTIRWRPAVAEPDGLSPQLRTEFELDKPVANARLYSSALGVYEVHLNGARVGDHELAPGWTDYDTRVQYQTFDVTDLLAEGDNAIGAMLGTGWYAGHIAIFGPSQYGTQPWFLARLEVTYADGTTEVVTTDDTWRTADGPVLTSDMLMGETYDARERTPGWTEPGFDDGGWQPAIVKDDVTAELVTQADPPVRVTEEITPVQITEPEDGVYVVDMGQNMVGTVRLRVEGPAGTTVQLRHAEVLNDDGTIYTDNLRTAEATDRYTLAGDGEEVYEPHFTFHGFRYVEITGFPGEPDLDTLTGLVKHTDAPMTSSFETGNPLLDQLYSNITWGQRGNFLSIPTDTPARDERMGWTGDINVFVGAAAYNMDVSRFLTKWLQDLRDAQFDNGAFTDVAPIVGFLGGGSAGWGDAGVTVPYTLWQRYGDLGLLEEHYPAMQAWISYLEEHSEGYLRPAEGYGDWLNVDDETPKDVIGTAYFAHSATLVAEMAATLGHDEDAQRYEQLAADVRAAFVEAYVDDEGRVEGDSQTAYVLALGFDVLPDELRDQAANRLVELIKARDWHLSTGFLGTPDLLPVLTETGHMDVAYRLIMQDTFPSWGYQIANGATTMWEHWDSIKPDGTFQDPAMNSFNHYAYGAVGEWMFRNIAGIQQAAPGFERIVIHPRPGADLDHASASYQSAMGEIATSWRRTERSFELDVTVPPNTTAEVWVPARVAAAVTESGGPAGEADGVTFDRMADGFAVFDVGSGDYQFAADQVLGQLYLGEQAAPEVSDAVDDVRSKLSDDQAAYLDQRAEAIADVAAAALENYAPGDDDVTVRQVHRALGETGRVIDWLRHQERAGLPADVVTQVTDAVRAVHTPLSEASALLLGVRATVSAAEGSVSAGDAFDVEASVENAGDTRLQGVEMRLDVPDGWTVESTGSDRTASLPPGETFTARFTVTTPPDQPVTAGVDITATSTFSRAGGRADLTSSTSVDVRSPVTIEELTADPRIVDEPGSTVSVSAVVVNGSGIDVTGDVHAAVPDGWSVEPAAVPYDLAAGERMPVTFDVHTPDEPAAADVRLTASYAGNDGDTAAIRLTYALQSWLFETDGDAEGWRPENHLGDFDVSDGALRTTSLGGDPFMVNDADLEIDASDGLTVEITMQTSASSDAQVFWTSDADPNFTEGKSTKFSVEAGEMRTYRVPIRAFDGVVTGLRLDPLTTEGDIVIDAIRIVQ